MKHESGRSLIEMVGVMAIAGVMTAGAFGVYKMIRDTQLRTIAAAELQEIVKNTKLLMSIRDNYDGVSVNYLIKAGALSSARAPIGGDNWSITSNGETFSINLVDLGHGECDYFTTAIPTWAKSVTVNGFTADATDHCFSTATNRISFIVE